MIVLNKYVCLKYKHYYDDKCVDQYYGESGGGSVGGGDGGEDDDGGGKQLLENICKCNRSDEYKCYRIIRVTRQYHVFPGSVFDVVYSAVTNVPLF